MSLSTYKEKRSIQLIGLELSIHDQTAPLLWQSSSSWGQQSHSPAGWEETEESKGPEPHGPLQRSPSDLKIFHQTPFP